MCRVVRSISHEGLLHQTYRAQVVMLSNGSLLINMRDQSSSECNCRLQAVSDNNGISFQQGYVCQEIH